MFAWHENEAVRTRRYWIGAREQVWDGSRTQERADEVRVSREAAKPAEASADRTGEEPPLGTVGLITMAVIMLLIGGFVGHLLARPRARRWHSTTRAGDRRSRRSAT